ncbi:MAG: glucuronate isomerase [Saprospiraceae bacterium]
MKTFLDKDFLLNSDTAATLYHDFAAAMPIVDYHNHLPPAQIAGDHQFENITQAWLYGDHYKWRAMRTLGIDEAYVTGAKSDVEKFEKWAKTVPYTLRNPLYHWTHLELQRYFGIDTLLDPNSADAIFEQSSHQLRQKTHSVFGLLDMRKVQVVCTTDDPTDDLMHHTAFAKSGNALKMYPSFRPDKFILIESDQFLPFVEKLGEICASDLSRYDDLLAALRNRAQFFASLGCRAADHGLESISRMDYTSAEIQSIYRKKRSGGILTAVEIEQFKSAILYDLGLIYHELGWVQQFHLGALRNNNLRAMRVMGADTGWDSIGDWTQAKTLSKFLARLDHEDKLAKTVLYNLNPADNEIMATMVGNFNDGSLKGKIQFGSAWWFLDQKDGMEKQINALSNMGMLSCFIGMLTDSRSFLSFPRHEYFRRILCNLFGSEIERGELPNDVPWIGKIIQDICYNNVVQYLNLENA